MKKYRGELILAIDCFIVVLSYLLAYFIRVDFGNLYSYQTFSAVIFSLPIIVLLNIFFSYILKINQSLWQYISIDEVIRVCFFTMVSNLTWFVAILTLQFDPFPKTVPVIAMMIQTLLMLGVRLFYRYYRRTVLQSNRKHKALIIGAGSAGAIALRDITISSQYDSKVVGFIDDNPNKKGKVISGIEILGTTDELLEIVKKTSADTVFIAIKNISKKDLKIIIEKCRKINLQTKIVNFDFIDSEKSTVQIRDVSIEDLLGRNEVSLNNDEIKKSIENKTIMITGGGGSIGSELCRQILNFYPSKIILFDIYENNMYDLQQEIARKKSHHEILSDAEIICLIGSVRDKNRINEVMRTYHPNIIFHAAAHKHVPLMEDSPAEAIKNNVFGTLNVVKCSIDNKVDTFVLISTDKAVNPTNVMGASKRICEMIMQSHRDNGVTKMCAVRFGNVLGSNGSVIPLFREQIKAGGPVTVTDPEIIRYFMTIPEAAQLVLQASIYAHNGEIFILDMGEPVKIDSLARNLIRLSGFVPDVDIMIQYTGLRNGEKLYEEKLMDEEGKKKTDNALIHIGEPIPFDTDLFFEDLKLLEKSCADNSSAIISAVEKIVPTFHPVGKNSYH